MKEQDFFIYQKFILLSKLMRTIQGYLNDYVTKLLVTSYNTRLFKQLVKTSYKKRKL